MEEEQAGTGGTGPGFEAVQDQMYGDFKLPILQAALTTATVTAGESDASKHFVLIMVMTMWDGRYDAVLSNSPLLQTQLLNGNCRQSTRLHDGLSCNIACRPTLLPTQSAQPFSSRFPPSTTPAPPSLDHLTSTRTPSGVPHATFHGESRQRDFHTDAIDLAIGATMCQSVNEEETSAKDRR